MGYTETQTRAFYTNLPAGAQRRVAAARKLLLEAHPQVKEEWKQRAIFFKLHSALAILLMAHTPPRLMFLKGHFLEAGCPLLVNGGTQYSRYVLLDSNEVLASESFYLLIQRAVELNLRIAQAGIKGVRRNLMH